jgi:predicted flap endonuclease-1-like 5' DNA nuclease
MNMRLDYTLYVLAALLLIATVVPFVVTVEGVESDTRSLWVITTVVLGLLSIGLGYSQRPKTEAQACQSAVTTPQETMPQTQPATTIEAPKEEKTVTQIEKAAIKKAPKATTPATATIELTQVKGIGGKRATQLKALGINSANDLSKASAKTLAKKLKISPKTVTKWVDSAKELVK